MDAVRFSIMDNHIEWMDNNEDNDNDEISSESSADVIQEDITSIDKSHDHFQQDIWQADEIEATLRNMSLAQSVFEFVQTGNIQAITANQIILDIALLVAVWCSKSQLVALLLRNYGADPNAADSKGRTAIHLACAIGDANITKILLDADADSNQWDASGTVTPMHCAANAGSVECILQLLKRKANVNAGIERRSALHFAVEKNFTECVEILLKYGANPNTPQVYTETPLHTAAAHGHTQCMELLLKHGADVRSQFGKKRLTALHLAAEDDYVDCVRILLDNGAEINASNADQQTALHLACLSQCAETLEVLINRGADVHAVYKDGRTALHASIVKQSKCYECARLLLDTNVDVNRADDYGYTPLHIAALNEFSSCVHMLIEHGADITARTNGGVTALSFMVRRTPEVIPKFLNNFDSSVKVNEHEIGDVDCEIKLDFNRLVPCMERGETELLLAFIEVGQKRVLKHPLCETFLFLKWRRIRKFFLFSLFYHAIFVLLFTMYVLAVYDKDCPPIKRRKVTKDIEGIWKCRVSFYVAPVGYAVFLLNMLLLAKEFFQMSHGFYSYVRCWENWLQWTIIVAVFLCATPMALKDDDLELVPYWQHHVAAIAIFLVWLELMMLVGRFPIFGVYVQMFTKVSMNFSKFLLAYCCLLIAFGLSLSVLFPYYSSFQNVPGALLKTILMMAGELEFENIFYGSRKVDYPFTAHAIFLAFVVLITVILTNLLVGLAVSDIQGLQASAGLDRLSRQAELVSRLESLLFSKILRKGPVKIIRMFQRTALLRTSQYCLQFCIRPNDPRDQRLPKDLVASIYKLVAERRDKNQSIRQKKREENLSMFSKSLFEQSEVRLRKKMGAPIRIHSDNPQNLSKIEIPACHDNNVRAIKIQLTDIADKVAVMQENFVKQMEQMTHDLAHLRREVKHGHRLK